MPFSAGTLTLLADLTGRGFRVRAAGGKVGVSPASVLSDGDWQAIRQHRDELSQFWPPMNRGTWRWFRSERATRTIWSCGWV
jgi:hypothetical protein